MTIGLYIKELMTDPEKNNGRLYTPSEASRFFWSFLAVLTDLPPRESTKYRLTMGGGWSELGTMPERRGPEKKDITLGIVPNRAGVRQEELETFVREVEVVYLTYKQAEDRGKRRSDGPGLLDIRD